MVFVLMVNVWPYDLVDIDPARIPEMLLTIDQAKVPVVRMPLYILANVLDSIWPNEMDSNQLEIHAQIFVAHHHRSSLDNKNDHLYED